jgi:hypothetical protein
MAPLTDKRDQQLAVIAQVLYLGNLLALPGILLLALVAMYFRFARGRASGLAAVHIRQAIGASLLALLLLGGGAAVFWLIGYYGAGGWTAVILYLLVVHTSFVMLGIIALARAMAGKALLGR